MNKISNIKLNIKEVLGVSIPLIVSMFSGVIMMLVDRLCLSTYKEETLAASGPAVYNSVAIVTFFVGVVAISRVFIAQSNGNNDINKIRETAISSILVALLLMILFICLKPVITLIPTLSNRDYSITSLEIQYMNIVIYYGSFMILNSAFSSILNGLLKTKMVMTVGIVGNVINAIFTYLLVFGKFSFPELGMKGSAYGTLIATSFSTVLYLIIIWKSKIFDKSEFSIKNNIKNIKGFIINIFKVGIPSGAAQALDESCQALFVSFVGGISVCALMANNISLSINYLIVIPLIGLGSGSSIIIAKKIGEGNKDKIWGTIVSSIIIGVAYAIILTIIEYIFSYNIIKLFMADKSNMELLYETDRIVKVLFIYALAFSISMIMGGALDAVGLSKYVLTLRLIIVLCIGIPIIYFLCKNNSGNMDMVPICWVILSFFEFLLGITYLFVFLKKGMNEKSLIS